MPIGLILGFQVPDAPKFQVPELARMVFIHLPCALISSLFLFAGPWFAFRALRSSDRKWDVRAESAMEVGGVFGILTLLTGMLFAKTQWGAWWNWDPRQSSYLMVMFIVAAYFVLRKAFGDAEVRMQNSGAYLMAALLPVVFLIFVYPRLPQVTSLHPNVIQEGSLDQNYKNVFYTMLLTTGLAGVWLYKLRVAAGILELENETYDAELDDRRRAGRTGVVRPVSVPAEGPEAAG